MQTTEEFINSLTPDACRDLAINKSAIPLCRKAAADRLAEKRHRHRHHPEVAEIVALPVEAFLQPQPPPAKDEVVWPNLSEEINAEVGRLIDEVQEDSGPLQASVTTETMWSQGETPLVMEVTNAVPLPSDPVLVNPSPQRTKKSKKETPAIIADTASK